MASPGNACCIANSHARLAPASSELPAAATMVHTRITLSRTAGSFFTPSTGALRGERASCR